MNITYWVTYILMENLLEWKYFKISYYNYIILHKNYSIKSNNVHTHLLTMSIKFGPPEHY